MINKIFRDECLIEDFSCQPKGFVIITDPKTGEVLVKKHNMIVKEGKDFIFATVIQNLFLTTPSLESNDYYTKDNLSFKISQMRFGNSTADTHFTRTYSADNESTHLRGNDTDIEAEPIYHHDITSDNIEVGTSNDHPYIKISKDLSFSNTTNIDNISELELIMVDTLTEGKKSNRLFSRIKFDVIPISAGSEFSIEYYIYF